MLPLTELAKAIIRRCAWPSGAMDTDLARELEMPLDAVGRELELLTRDGWISRKPKVGTFHAIIRR